MSIEKIAVIGSGLMGHGIAQVAAMSGQEVSFIGRPDAALERTVQIDHIHMIMVIPRTNIIQ